MRIVRPTNPSSMRIIVDTVIYGERILELRPSHAIYDRIDAVYVGQGTVGITTGAQCPSPTIPAIPPGMRTIAKIRVGWSMTSIVERDIEEIL